MSLYFNIIFERNAARTLLLENIRKKGIKKELKINSCNFLTNPKSHQHLIVRPFSVMPSAYIFLSILVIRSEVIFHSNNSFYLYNISFIYPKKDLMIKHKNINISFRLSREYLVNFKSKEINMP